MLRYLLAWLLAFSVAAPARAAPADAPKNFGIGVGLGAVRGDCYDVESRSVCARGGRAEILLNVLTKEAKPPASSASEKAPTVHVDGSSRGWGPNFHGGGSGKGWNALVVIVVVAVLLIGVIWLLATVFSTKVQLGVYHAQDFLADRWPVSGDGELARFHSQRTGLQLNFFLFDGVPLQIYGGAAVTRATLELRDETDAKARYELKGIASKAGIGFARYAGPGAFFNYEFERILYTNESVGRYLLDPVAKTQLPRVNKTGTVMTGFVVPF